MNLAVFGTSDGGLLVGKGPFESFAEPPEYGVAFYRNDFALSSPTPWLVPSEVERIERGVHRGTHGRHDESGAT